MKRLTCSKCGLRKTLSAFCKNKSLKGGVSGRCKECVSDYFHSPKGRETIAKYYRLNPSKRYKMFKRQCELRPIRLSISEKQYVLLVTGARCTYCSGPLPDVGYGLDRVDNSLHYSKDNVVTCCGICNKVKGGIFTFDEMISHIGPIISKIRREREAKGISLSSRDADHRTWKKKT